MTQILQRTVAPALERSPACVYLELPTGAVKDIRGMKVGTPVVLQIKGKLVSYSERQPEMGDPSEGAVGSISVEYTKIEVLENENQFLDLIEDEDD